MLELHNIVLEIYNIMLELVNKTHKVMRKTIFIAVLSVSVLVSMIFWLVRSEVSLNLKGSSMVIIQFVVVVFAIFFAFRRLRSAKQNLPAEDEMSKKILRRGAATSYYVSIYMWLAFMFFEERIDLERSTLIGAGILGMALIYALSWIYHNYIRPSHD
jgi:peptidoglycan/LPS O-acetylase OafA/YrhL